MDLDADAQLCNPPPAVLIQTLRDRAGLSQEVLAERAGVSQSALSRLERGGVATLNLLSQLLRPLGLQLRLEVEPLVDDIDAQLDAESGRTREERFEFAAYCRLADGFDIALIEEALGEFPHLYGGLTGAALMGAPIRPTECELVLLNDDNTHLQFISWLIGQSATRWNDAETRYGGQPLDPREPGTKRWTTLLGQVSAQFVRTFPPSTTVDLGGKPYAVVGLSHLDATDSHARRVLERVRERLASEA